DRTFRRALEAVERNAWAQSRLIEDLLDFARLRSGKVRLDSAQVRLDEVLQAAIESVRPQAEAKRLDLGTRVPAAPVFVTGDPLRLQQVLWNVLGNAVKFTPPGGSIRATLDATGSHVTIVIEDSGIGIEPDLLPHVFDRYVRAESTNGSTDGLGLGLWIV